MNALKLCTIFLCLLIASNACSSNKGLIIGVSEQQPIEYVDILILDPMVQYFDTKIDGSFINKNYAIKYHSSAGQIFRRMESLMPAQNERSISLPSGYPYLPSTVFIFSNGRSYLYDGCYIKSTDSNSYHLTSHELRATIASLSFSEVNSECE